MMQRCSGQAEADVVPYSPPSGSISHHLTCYGPGKTERQPYLALWPDPYLAVVTSQYQQRSKGGKPISRNWRSRGKKGSEQPANGHMLPRVREPDARSPTTAEPPSIVQETCPATRHQLGSEVADEMNRMRCILTWSNTCQSTLDFPSPLIACFTLWFTSRIDVGFTCNLISSLSP